MTILGRPRINPVVDPNGVCIGPDASHSPRYLVYPVNWANVDTQYILTEPRIIDFGEAYDMNQPPDALGIPGPYRSPELYLDRMVDVPCDMWALATTIFEIRTGRKLFDSWENNGDEFIEEMCLIMGKLPEPWWSQTWEARKAIFKDEADEDNRVVEVPGNDPQSLKIRNIKEPVHPSIAQGARSLSEKLAPGLWYLDMRPTEDEGLHREICLEERVALEDFLRQLLVYQPLDRIGAVRALRHDWFRVPLQT